MLWAILQTIISKISNAFYAKTTKYEISGILNELLSFISGIFGVLALLILGKFNIILFSNWDYFLIFISIVVYFIQIEIDKVVYEKEKLTAIIPFQNVGKVIAVLLGIVVLGEQVSGIGLTFFILTFLYILSTTIDVKKLTFSKNILMYIFSKFKGAGTDLITGYILIKNSELDYYNVYVLMCVALLFVVVLVKKDFKYLKNLDKNYYISNIIAGFGWLSWIISLFLIKEMGLSITVMLGFLGIGVSLIMSYLIFKETPSKKDIINTVIITLLVIAGFLLS